MSEEKKCHLCGNTRNLDPDGPGLWICEWRGGCEHRQRRMRQDEGQVAYAAAEILSEFDSAMKRNADRLMFEVETYLRSK